MYYQFGITLTEEDYLAFNIFHSFESAHGKKMIRNSRILFAAIVALLTALYVLLSGWSAFTIVYVIIMGLFTVLYSLLFKKIFVRNLKAQIRRHKKLGKLPFDPISTMEFHEEKIVELTASKRTEQSYSGIERVCVLQGRYIFLYNSSIGAYILPIPQVNAQLDQNSLLTFLSQRCKTIEYYLS